MGKACGEHGRKERATERVARIKYNAELRAGSRGRIRHTHWARLGTCASLRPWTFQPSTNIFWTGMNLMYTAGL